MDLPSYKEIFGQTKLNFWIIGIEFNNPKLFVRFYVYCFFLTIMVIGEFAYITSKINSGGYNFVELLELVPCMCIGLLSLLKIIFLAAKKDKMFKLKDKLEILYNDATSDVRKKTIIFKEVLNNIKFLRYFFSLNVVLISVYNFATPVFMLYDYVMVGTVAYSLPYPILTPFSMDTLLSWFFVYMFSISCGVLCVFFFTTADTLFCIFTSHVCNNFAILSDEIKYLDECNNNSLNGIIRRHQDILKLSTILEDIFRLPNLFNYLVGSLEICALGFCITTGTWSHFLGYILFLLSVLLQILMMSVFGENIIRESRKVGEAAYLSKWHLMNERAKKTILIIMIRAHKQQQLTAFKFSVISYGSFSKIISTSWSYFTILKTVYKP